MTIKYSPEVKKILKAAGFSDEQIRTAEVKDTNSYNRALNMTPEELTEEERRRYQDKFGDDAFNLKERQD